MDDVIEIKRDVANYSQLTTEKEDYFISLLRITKIRKRQCIVQPNFTCKYRSYVLKGSLLAYWADNKAQNTIAFAIEGGGLAT